MTELSDIFFIHFTFNNNWGFLYYNKKKTGLNASNKTSNFLIFQWNRKQNIYYPYLKLPLGICPKPSTIELNFFIRTESPFQFTHMSGPIFVYACWRETRDGTTFSKESSKVYYVIFMWITFTTWSSRIEDFTRV